LSALNLPNRDDSLVLITPPTTVVDTRLFLYGHRLYTIPLHTKRLADWLDRCCGAFLHIDCLGDPESRARPIGTRTAGPRSKSPQEVACFAYGLDEAVLRRKLTEIARPTQVWITTLFAYDRTFLAETIAVVRAALPGVPIVVGGSYASLCPDDCKAMGADHVHQGILHEAEDVGPTRIGPFGFVVAGRGCPNRCSYCAFSYIEGRRPVCYDPEKVLAQAGELAAGGISALALYSPSIFRGALARPSELIVEGLADFDFGVVGWAGFEPKAITPRRAELLHEAGFVDITVPIQTLDRETAKSWGRREALSDFERAVDTLLGAGFSRLEISSDVIMGHPDQTLEETLRSMCYIWSRGITPAVFPYTWIPRSADAKRLNVDLKVTPAESFQPYLFPFADTGHTARDYIEAAKLSRILPQLVDTALEYLDPNGPVPSIIKRYLDEFGFDVPQWRIEGSLPKMKFGYSTFLSHPWELAMALRDEDSDRLPLWLSKACCAVRAFEPNYDGLRTAANE